MRANHQQANLSHAGCETFGKVLTEHAADSYCRRLPPCQSPGVAVVVLAGVYTWYRIRTKGSSKCHQGQARR